MHGFRLLVGHAFARRFVLPSAAVGGSAPGDPALPSHIGPLIPPSFRTRQKWIMISSATASGIATQCRT